MSRDAMRTSRTRDGSKIAVWKLVRRAAFVLRAQFPAERFIAYRLPSQVLLPDAQPGTIIFDTYPDLPDAREMLPDKHLAQQRTILEKAGVPEVAIKAVELVSKGVVLPAVVVERVDLPEAPRVVRGGRAALELAREQERQRRLGRRERNG